MAQQANAQTGAKIAPSILAKLQKKKFSTGEVSNEWFHCLLYSGTDARKSTTAAKFGTPENTRIILVRRKEQLIPLRKLNYKAFLASDWSDVQNALLYPEAIWPEWAGLADRTLILDDATEAKDMAIEDNEVREDGSEVKDFRQVIKGTLGDMRPVIKAVLRKPLHFIIVSMSRQFDVTKDQGTVSPDLPSSIANLMMTDMEFVFYIDKKKWQIVTGEKRVAGLRKNEKGKDEPYIQTIFAKHKLPEELEGKGILKPEESMNLRAIWEKIRAAGTNPANPTNTIVGNDQKGESQVISGEREGENVIEELPSGDAPLEESNNVEGQPATQVSNLPGSEG